MPNRLLRQILLSTTLVAGTTSGALAAANDAPLVHGLVSDAVTTRLPGDVPGALRNATDLGPLGGGTALPDVLLTLKRSPQRQAALDALTQAQITKGSPLYHHWLTPDDLRTYGPSQADIAAVSRWLVSHGLTVNRVAPSGMTIQFGGTTANIQAAFHTQIHQVLRNGEAHIANVSAPAIPAALSSVVAGVTLSNFAPRPQIDRAIDRRPSLTSNTKFGTFYAVTPSDFATIYNENPLLNGTGFAGKVTGLNATVAVVEQTLIKPSDWLHFRAAFGLTHYPGDLTLTHPGNCASPGYTPDEVEAALDAEWSGATAPGAHIIEASCAGSAPFRFGVFTAFQNLVEYPTPATIFSISYGGPSQANGFGFQAAWNSLAEMAAAEGKTVFVSSGDSGSSADRNRIDYNGLDVNGLSDPIYITSVGGTDFLDTALNEDTKYWSASNSPTGESAKSYVPEIPWDNSCANSILAGVLGVSPQVLCNITPVPGFIQNGVGGTGGRSLLYRKPSWQVGVTGMPRDGVRDQPDVSLFAANGLWSHFLVFCMSDASEGGAPCDYSPNGILNNAAGGTSFAAPAFAGIAALVAQNNTPPNHPAVGLGNMNPGLYALANAQFHTPLALGPCNSTLGNGVSRVCAFYTVTAGDNAEPCHAGTLDCTTTSASTAGIGILTSVIDGKTVDAFPAGLGYDLATGLGTVNVSNLVYGYYSL